MERSGRKTAVGLQASRKRGICRFADRFTLRFTDRYADRYVDCYVDC